ncbi:MAG: Mg2+/Co2+ transporter, partial [Oligoflexia bacterium]|nr:Mg2+/Co2+ transporter [Oligoflexia bacterium]
EIQNEEMPVIVFFEKLYQIIIHELNHATRGTDFLMHIILDYIIDRKLHIIENFEDELNNIEKSILMTPLKLKSKTLMKVKRDLFAMKKSIVHEREMLLRICRRDSPFVSEKAIYHYRDIYDHLTKFYESTENLREMISSLMEMSFSVMNNQMAILTMKTNHTVRRLTLITTIFMPLTLLAGIGGMSEWSMMTGSQNWKISYPIFIGVMIVIGFLNYLLLKKYDSTDKN